MDDDRATRMPAPDDDRATHMAAPDDDRATAMAPPQAPANTTPAAGPARPEWAPGQRILRGQFELLNSLRGGAQARAFRGRALDGRDVFVKIQANPWGRDDVFAKQLELRPKLLALAHPNLLRCLALDVDHGDLCEVYEFVQGQELAALLRAGPLAEPLVRQLVADLAAGVQALHDAGLMHRDLKPGNVMLREGGAQPQFLIVDYGIVSRLDEGGLTRVAGTVQYSPPERMQRFIENNELSRTWDWWSLGSIVQEAIAGVHPYQRLRELFPAELAGARGGSQVLEHLFDEIQREGAIERYRMHAGMVEVSERDPAAQPWLPLLRGLLTFNRAQRWGHEQVRAFLAGQTPADHYHERRERDQDLRYDDGAGREWRSVADCAAALAQQAGEAPAGEANEPWQRARRQVHKGDFARHVRERLHDAELLQRLMRCIWLDPERREGAQLDPDLGTALALFVLAEGAIPRPALCGVALDADYARYLAAQTDGRADPALEARLRELLLERFQTLLREVAPEAARAAAADAATGLRQLRESVDALRHQAGLMGVRLPEALLRERPSLLVRLVSTPHADDVRIIEQEYRSRLGGSTNPALQAVFGAARLQDVAPLELKALRLALQFIEDNGFETHQAVAARIQAQSRQLRAADALVRGARRMWQPPPKFTALLLFTLAAVALLGEGINLVGRTWQAQWDWATLLSALDAPNGDPRVRAVNRALRLLPIWPIIWVALALGVSTAWLARRVRAATLKDLAKLGLPFNPGNKPRLAARQVAASLVGAAPSDEPQASYARRLARLNARVRALPNIDTAQYLEKPAPLPRSNALLVLVALLVLLPWAAGPLARMFHPAGLYAFVPALAAAARSTPGPATPFGTNSGATPGTTPGGALEPFRFPAALVQAAEVQALSGTCRLPAGTLVLANRPITATGPASIRPQAKDCATTGRQAPVLRVRPVSGRAALAAQAWLGSSQGKPVNLVDVACFDLMVAQNFATAAAADLALLNCLGASGRR